MLAILLPERPLRLRAGLSDAMEERATSGEGAAIAAAD